MAKLRAIHKQFTVNERPVEALAGIDLDIRTGEFLCIVGPSGCGKTTLLRILAGLDRPTSGTVELVRDRSRRPLHSLVFQERGLLPWLSVRDNVAFGLKARGVPRAARYAVADPLIDRVGLRGFERALPHQLSGGMKQRVSLARALASDPRMLLMDEPFASLDEQTRLILHGELLRIWDETHPTVVFVTHSIDEALALGDRLVVMSARPGQIRDVIDVQAHFGRPRCIETMKSSRAYGRLFGRVWSTLRQEVA